MRDGKTDNTILNSILKLENDQDFHQCEERRRKRMEKVRGRRTGRNARRAGGKEGGMDKDAKKHVQIVHVTRSNLS